MLLSSLSFQTGGKASAPLSLVPSGVSGQPVPVTMMVKMMMQMMMVMKVMIVMVQ